jgi:small conductance mechanosensitive channel
MFVLLQQQAQETGMLDDMTSQATDWVATAQDLGFQYGPPLLKALVVFIIGRWVVKIIVGIIAKLMLKKNIDETITGFLTSLLRSIGLVLVIITAVQMLGVETTSFVAILGAGTLAVGFALQGSLGNFAAGVMLLIFRPFKQGDYVEIAGTSGTVDAQAVFATTLRTPDNRKIIIPNSAITDGVITNYSAHPTRRVDMVMGVSYNDDLKGVKNAIMEILNSDERVLKDPAPTVAVAELADSSVNFVVRPWCKAADYWAVKFDLTERMKVELEAAGFSIPFPQRDVHNYQAT